MGLGLGLGSRVRVRAIAVGCQRSERLSCVEDLAKRKACCGEM